MNNFKKDTKIQVVYASHASDYKMIEIEVKEPVTIETAINLSGILSLYPGIDLKKNKLGIFGKTKQLNDLAKPGDRIEIYRALLIDPKEARRKREKQKHKPNDLSNSR